MTRLGCENEFCIYQKDGNCTLNKIKLDVQGSCTDCIYIKIEKDTLNNLKERQLKNLQDLET